MKQPFERFYFMFGLRKISSLSNPRVFPIRELSQNAILHCLSGDDALFPDDSSTFLKDSAFKVLLSNVTDLLPNNKSLGRKSFQPLPMVTDFIQGHRSFQRMTQPLAKLTEKNQTVAVNYNLLKSAYRYAETDRMRAWGMWEDQHRAMWAHINELADNPNYHHYVEVKLPDTLPALSVLKQFLNVTTTDTLKKLQNGDNFFMLDLMRWLTPPPPQKVKPGEEPQHVESPRDQSTMSVLDIKKLPLVNLIFRIKDGQSVIVNLGYLNSWLDGQPNQTEFTRVSQVAPNAIYPLILKFYMGLQNYNVEHDAAAREAETAKEDDRQSLEPSDPGLHPDKIGDGGSKVAGPNDKVKATSIERVLGGTSKNPTKDTDDSEGSTASKIDPGTGKSELDLLIAEAEADVSVLEEMDARRADAEEAVAVYDPTELPPKEEIVTKALVAKSPLEKLSADLDDLVAENAISAADFKKISKIIQEQPDLADPYGTGKTLAEASTITAKDLELDKEAYALPSDERVIDKSMAGAPIEYMTRNYIRNNMRKHILASILGVQNNKVLVTNIETEVHHSVLGTYEMHAVTLKPLKGQTSTVYIRVPLPDEDGTYRSNGVKYYMREQRVDLPIRKISPERVSLSSYVSKMFVMRSPKKADSGLAAVVKHLTAATIGEVSNVFNVKPADVFDNLFKSPYIHGALGKHYKSFSVKHSVFGELNFDLSLKETFGKSWVVGSTNKGRKLLVDADNTFHVHTDTGEQPLGDIYDVLEMDRLKVPVDFTVTKIMGTTVPVGLILARAMGFRGLLSFLGCRYRTVKTRTQKGLQPHEYFITFADHVFILDRRDVVASLILGGFQDTETITRKYEAAMFDEKDVYDNLFDHLGSTASFVRELDNLEGGFVDPMTRDVLKSMKEPETWLGLLVRSCELLQTYYHPNTQDFTQQRIRGFERFAGFIYKEFAKSVRAFNNRNISGRSKIEMSPFAVFSAIREDPTISTSQDINPIQNLKAHEALTYVGEGGRSKDAFMKDARAYDETDPGIVSEASVDSGDVGVNIFRVANPKFGNMLGMKTKEPIENVAGNYLSSSLLLAVGGQHDDQKRNAFVSIQNAHTVACDGYRQPYVQTGYETLAAQRLDKIFAFAAEKDGQITELTDKAVKVTYKDGSSDFCALGRQYGSSEGSTYPHDILPLRKLGEKVKKGDVLAYNSGFFEQDFLDPHKVVMKFATYVETAFEEIPETHEDSCAVASETADLLKTKTTKVKSYVVRFDQNLHNVLKPGTEVGPEDILMTISDEEVLGGSFDAASAATLSRYSRQSPTADHSGTVDKIEVYYHGDKIDMSPSIRALTNASDKMIVENQKAIGRPGFNGQVNGDYSVKGNPLLLDQCEVRFYITVNNEMGSGDKGVFYNQLKTTVGEVMDYQMHTESGIKIGARFGGRSALNRIVYSYAIIGTTVGNLKQLATRMVELYES